MLLYIGSYIVMYELLLQYVLCAIHNKKQVYQMWKFTLKVQNQICGQWIEIVKYFYPFAAKSFRNIFSDFELSVSC